MYKLYMGHGCSQLFVLCFCKEMLKNVFFNCFQVKTSLRSGCSVAQTVVRRSPEWQAQGSNLGPAPHGRLFLLSDSNGFSRGSRRFFSGFFLNVINSPEESAKLRWGCAPFCVVKSLNVKKRVRAQGQNPQVKKN
jgi:hypothetical protein